MIDTKKLEDRISKTAEGVEEVKENKDKLSITQECIANNQIVIMEFLVELGKEIDKIPKKRTSYMTGPR